jgi:hypothetical protein
LSRKIDYLETSSNNTLPSVTYHSKEKLSEVWMDVKPHIGKNSLIGPDLLQSPYVVKEISR